MHDVDTYSLLVYAIVMGGTYKQYLFTMNRNGFN